MRGDRKDVARTLRRMRIPAMIARKINDSLAVRLCAFDDIV
jgi:hypothetical protein